MPPQPSVPPMSPPQSGHPIVAVVITLMVVFASLGAAWHFGFVTINGVPTMFDRITQMQEKMLVDASHSSAVASSTLPLREGVYTLTGTNAGADAPSYTGSVTIVRRENSPDVYDLTWSIAGGTQTQAGVGIFTNGILSVGYFESHDGVIVDAGSVSYMLVDETHLEGEWVSATGGTTGIENLSLR